MRLALSLMFGLDGKREARVASMSISRPSLKAAAFSDAVSRFYAGPAVQFMRMLPVGMELKGPAPGAEPMLDGRWRSRITSTRFMQSMTRPTPRL